MVRFARGKRCVKVCVESQSGFLGARKNLGWGLAERWRALCMGGAAAVTRPPRPRPPPPLSSHRASAAREKCSGAGRGGRGVRRCRRGVSVPARRESERWRRAVRAQVQGCKGAGMQGCRDAGMQGCRDAGMQRCRVQSAGCVCTPRPQCNPPQSHSSSTGVKNRRSKTHRRHAPPQEEDVDSLQVALGLAPLQHGDVLPERVDLAEGDQAAGVDVPAQ